MFGPMGSTSAGDLVHYEEKVLSSEFAYTKVIEIL